MRTALITTTIHKPEVLSLYRAHDPDVMFFVAGDLKTPAEAADFCNEMDNCVYLTAHYQDGAYYKSSKLLGWNTDSRRNYALLEAMRWKADVIVSCDDDMIPNADNFFGEFNRACDTDPFWGLQLGLPNHWFDAGEFTIPKARQRGIPVDAQCHSAPSFVHNVQIGAAQGIILGVPDATASEAIANRPHVHSGTDILHSGFVVHPKANAVFNSQLTAFRGELAPAFAQFYFAQGRNTDIQASLLMRRIMRQRDLYTYFGPPLAYHARQSRPLLNDLRSEMIGNERMNEYADYLNRAPLPAEGGVVDWCRILAEGWKGPELEAAMAWYEDCEAVLK